MAPFRMLGQPRPSPYGVALRPRLFTALAIVLCVAGIGLTLPQTQAAAPALPTGERSWGSTPSNPVWFEPVVIDQTYYEVSIFDDRFDPEVLTIPVNGIVLWTNRGSTTHSVTSDHGLWSYTLPPGSRFSFQFIGAGTYPYHCSFHPQKRGTIIVGGQGPSPTPTPTVEPGATPPVPGGAIIYNALTTATTTDLFTIEPDGTQKRQLTSTPNLTEAQPRWSPDRLRVAFAAGQGPAPQYVWRIYVLDLVTNQVRPVTDGPEDYEPTWSPDGSWIAYTEVIRSGTAVLGTAISRVRPDGSDGTRLAYALGSAAGVGSPDWSPDGSRIAFVYRSDFYGGELYTIDAAGTRIERLLSHPGWDDIDPQWSPDGRYLAFAAGPAGGRLENIQHDLWLADLTTGTMGTIARAAGWNLRRPAWSPTGDSLVFNGRFGTGAYGLYTVPATGGAVFGPLDAGFEPDWGSVSLVPVVTPPGLPPTGTATPPLVPTFPPPGTIPTETPGLPPTFPPPTEIPIEPPTDIPTATAAPTEEATATATTAPTATHGPLRGRVFLPWLANQYAVGLATPTPETVACLTREVEPNNTTAEADSRAPLCYDRMLRGSLPPSDPEDIFRLEVETLSRLGVDLYLIGLPAGTDYDLLLYRAGALDPVAVSRNEGTQAEHVEAEVSPGRYYLRVVPAAQSVRSEAEYRLTAYRQ